MPSFSVTALCHQKRGLVCLLSLISPQMFSQLSTRAPIREACSVSVRVKSNTNNQNLVYHNLGETTNFDPVDQEHLFVLFA